MISSQDVVQAYRLFLGREPESSEVVQRLQQECANLEELRMRFLSSSELRSSFSRFTAEPSGSKPLNWPPISVETKTSADQLDTLIRHVEGNWKILGENEPHWSVLSDDKFLSKNIASTEENFYDSGKHVIDLLTATAGRNSIELSEFKRCFELGCGLGRLTLWLSRQFQHVDAMDVSPSHLKLAADAMASYERENVSFLKLSNLTDLDAIEDFDIFVSIIVLQHNPPPIIAALLERILSKLNPGGIAYFQLSTYHVGYKFKLDQYVKSIKDEGRIEMHVLPHQELFKIIYAANCQVLEIREDTWTGQAEGISNTLLVRKDS